MADFRAQFSEGDAVLACPLSRLLRGHGLAALAREVVETEPLTMVGVATGRAALCAHADAEANYD